MPSREQITIELKAKTVLRLLGGEPREALASELGVSAQRLTRWEHVFVRAGEAALKKDAEMRSHGWLYRHRAQLAQWLFLILALLAATLLLTRFMTTEGL